MAAWLHSPWDWVRPGRLLHPGQSAQLPLSVEVSLRTIRSRWKCWHLAFPCAPLLPMNGYRTKSPTLELVPQHSLVEARALLRSLSYRAVCPSSPFCFGLVVCLRRRTEMCTYCINQKYVAVMCMTLTKVNWSNPMPIFSANCLPRIFFFFLFRQYSPQLLQTSDFFNALMLASLSEGPWISQASCQSIYPTIFS